LRRREKNTWTTRIASFGGSCRPPLLPPDLTCIHHKEVEVEGGELCLAKPLGKVHDVLKSVTHLSQSYNTHDEASRTSLRPDYFLYGSVPLYKEEWKKESKELEKAKGELVAKMEWLSPQYDQVGWIPVCAIAGSTAFLGMLSKGVFQSTLQELSTFQLAQVHERSRYLKAMLNVARLVLYLNTQVLSMWDDFALAVPKVRLSCKITIHQHHVHKSYFQKEVFLRVLSLYEMVKAVPNVPRVRESSEAHLWMNIIPRGLRRLPTETELSCCVGDILQALNGLHDLKIIHCDVRWPNIIYYEGHWTLIDLDNAKNDGELFQPPTGLYPPFQQACPQLDWWIFATAIQKVFPSVNLTDLSPRLSTDVCPMTSP